MASAAESYVKGSEYELPDGTLGVWSGKGFVTAEAYLKMKGESQTQFDDKRALMTAIDRAEKKANWFTTGPLGKFQAGDDTEQPKWKGVPGSPGYNLDKALLPIRSNLFMTSLMEMRQNSPTGAGIGNPTNPEGKKIESKDGALDVGMSEDELRYNLNTIREAQARRTPGLAVSNPIVLNEGNRSEVPQSAYFRAADGRVYFNQRGAGFPGGGATATAKGGLTPAEQAELAALRKQFKGR